MTVTTAGDPPNALGTDGPEPYAPMVWDSTLPKANSVIASTYANATTPKDQYTEASKLNTMIIEQNHQTFDTLHSITSPAAMLVQVTGTCQLRVVERAPASTGISPATLLWKCYVNVSS